MKQSVVFILICKRFEIPKDISRTILDFANFKIINFIAKNDCIKIKHENKTQLKNDEFDPSDSIMFLPLETEGYQKEYYQSLDLDTRHCWYGDNERMQVRWDLDDSWSLSFKQNVAFKLLENIQWQFENSPIVFMDRLTN